MPKLSRIANTSFSLLKCSVCLASEKGNALFSSLTCFSLLLFLLEQGTISSSDHRLSKCFLPEESSVIAIYCGSAMALLLLALGHFHLFRGTLSFSSLLGKHKPL